jgi:hypothetical protein
VRALRRTLHLTGRNEVKSPFVCVNPKPWNGRRKFVKTFPTQKTFETDRDLRQCIDQQRRLLHGTAHHEV